MLTSLESALAALLDGLEPVAPTILQLDEAIGCVAAGMEPLDGMLPPHSTAAMDGWALFTADLAGASAYSPVPLAASPVWVESGDEVPEGRDCVLDADLLDLSGPVAQALAEAAPGEGIRRAAGDMAAGRPATLTGRAVTAADLLVMRAAGLDGIAVRRPRVRVIDAAARGGSTLTSRFLLDILPSHGAAAAGVETIGRDAGSIASAIESGACDLILLAGGTGDGRADATAQALALRNALAAHRIALRPGHTVAVGRKGRIPVVALPGGPDQAFAAFLALVLPVLDRLSGRLGRNGMVLPLARKVSSGVGVAEIALLQQERGAWAPLAVGSLSLDHMRLADAWLVVPADSEGYAAGTPVRAFPLRDTN